MTVAASSCGGTSRSDPPKPPTGVRSGSQMTASRTVVLPERLDRRASSLPPRRVFRAGALGGSGSGRNGSGDALGDLPTVGLLLGAQQVPQARDLQRAHDGAGGGDHAHADVLPGGAAVG